MKINIAQGRMLPIILLLLLGVMLVISMGVGSVSIPAASIIKMLLGGEVDNPAWSNILFKTRLPQTITAMSAGVALGLSGLMMQTLFRNPLAGPSILGISSGASLGVALVILVAGNLFNMLFSGMGLWGDVAIIFAAFLGSFFILLLILFLARRVRGTVTLLLIGIMTGYLASSITGMLKFYSFEEDVHTYVIWGLGSFSRLSLRRSGLMAAITLVPSLLSLLLAKRLNLLSLGEHYAINLGLDVRRSRWVIILVAGFLTAAVTAFCGPISFLGLALPHIARLLLPTSNHLRLMPMVALCGAIVALFCNVVARLPGLDGALPVNSVTALVGAPVVLSILLRKRKMVVEA